MSSSELDLLHTCGSSESAKEPDVHIYAVGGRYRGKTLRIVDRFSVEQMVWMPVSLMTEPRGSLGAVFTNGLVCALGGGGLASNLSSCEAFDVSSEHTQTWHPLPSFSIPRHALSATVSEDGGKIYVAGGWCEGTTSSDAVDCLDTRSLRYGGTSSWQSCAPMGTARRLHGLAALHGRVFAFGGMGTSQCLSSAECLDTGRNKWAPIADMPFGASCSACVVQDNVYVVAWGGGSSRLRSSGLLRYSPSADRYELVADLPLPEWFGFALASWDRWIYVLGGTTRGSLTGAFYRYDTVCGAWEQLPGLEVGRRRLALVVCPHLEPSIRTNP